MHKLAVISTIVAATLFAASCSDTDTPLDPNAPTTVHVVQVGIGLSPSTLVAQSVAHPICPSVPPFTTTLNLLVRNDGNVRLFVSTIRLRFVDRFGMQAPQVTLPAPVPTTQFGSALIDARDSRAFAIPFQFGCGTTRAGRITVFVDMRDDRGMTQSRQATVDVE